MGVEQDEDRGHAGTQSAGLVGDQLAQQREMAVLGDRDLPRRRAWPGEEVAGAQDLLAEAVAGGAADGSAFGAAPEPGQGVSGGVLA
ncbi:hypothetical protein GCM10010429_25550 [Micromonospora olivasterospora]